MARKFFRPGSLVLALVLAVLLGATPSEATAQSSIGITQKGKGPVIVFIAGLNSDSRTFTGTCDALAATHTCMLLDLPGFAGKRPVDVSKGFLVPMRDEVIRELRRRGISRAVLVGHSLGGVLGMMISLEAPELIERMVLIDSLPFYAAIQNPAMTVAQAKPMAAGMRALMTAQPDELYFRAAEQQTAGMVRSPERHPLLKEWARTSDRSTTTTAMTDMLVTDLRGEIARLKQPLLVLGAWAAYEQYGSTMESTRAIFATQYAAAPSVDIRLSARGYHFLTWDDGDWVVAQIRQFLDR